VPNEASRKLTRILVSEVQDARAESRHLKWSRERRSLAPLAS
jgi:hypothetical protein